MNIYISYSHQDLNHAKEIYSILRNEGLNAFIDEDNIPAGVDWENHLKNKISSSDAIILIWSKHAAKSAQVIRELTQSLIAKRKIIPCSIDEEEYNPLIENIQHISWSNTTKVQKILFKALGVKNTDNNLNPTYDSAIIKYRLKLQDEFSFIETLGRSEKYPVNEIYLPLNLGILNSSGKMDRTVSADELLSSEINKSIILGIPGSGKSTLLKYLVFKSANKNSSMLPIFLKISSIMETGDKLLEFITQHLKGMVGKKNGELISFHENFCRKGTLLLLDGLDEITPNDQDEFKKRLGSFQNAHPDIKIIITSRFSGYTKLDKYVHCHLKKLTENDIEKYIWSIVEDSKRKYLWNTIKNDSRILQLAKTPFLLSMMTIAPEEIGGTAVQRTTLYKSAIKYLLQGKNLNNELNIELNQEEKTITETLEDALKLIAVRFFKLNSVNFEEEEILFVIKGLKSNSANLSPSEILKRIYKYSGLLQKTGSSYYFIHRSIWEYFVAIGMQEEKLNNLVEKANIPIWEEPIRLFVGLSPERNLTELFSEIWNRNKGLALRAMNELDIFPDEILTKLIKKLEQPDRLRIVHQLRENIKSLGDNLLEAKRLLLDTLGALLKVEKDCEVIYESIKLLEFYHKLWGFEELSKLVASILDLGNSEKRLRDYIKDESFKLAFVCVLSGKFIMGTNKESRTTGEKPEHEVNLDSFCISRFQITNKLYYNKFPFGREKREERSFEDSQPAIYITWYEAYIFAKWLGCDLPTEAEWEYACRAGGDDDNILFDYNEIPKHAWYVENSDNITHPVGLLKPNSIGIYDMLGNVREWCKDWFQDSYYQYCIDEGILNNPQGATNGVSKVLKGGCFDWNIANLVPTYRNYNLPSNSYFVNGFRLVFRGEESILKINN